MPPQTAIVSHMTSAMGESAQDPGRVDIKLLCVMYERDTEASGIEVAVCVCVLGGGFKPCSNVWEAHKTYYRRAVKRANISVQI